jgi:hypothetical protein
MPNGDYLSPDELREYAKPLEAIKDRVNSFAKKEGVETEYYWKGWPSIDLRWKNSHGLNCHIQFIMRDDRLTFSLWAVSSKDIEQENFKRYIKDKRLQKALKTPFDVDFLLGEMKKGIELCNSWKFEDLGSHLSQQE